MEPAWIPNAIVTMAGEGKDVLCRMKMNVNTGKIIEWDILIFFIGKFVIFNLWIGFRVSIRKTFAQFLRNETQIFSFFAHQFCAKKNNNLRNHSQKSFRAKLPYSAFAKLKFWAIPQLEFCAIPQFRKNQTVGDGVCFLEFNSGKILFWNVFLLVTFT